jgi:histidyl-tRNA synthetase
LGELYRSIDKIDKIGAEGVREELIRRGLPPDVVTRMMELIRVELPEAEKLDYLEDVLGSASGAAEGLDELRELIEHLNNADVPSEFYAFDFTMVRGLSYYTGPIYETIITEPNLGSVTGGGRYDDLVGMFRGESLPTTGTSLGIERIIDLMDILGLYPPEIGGTVVQVLVTVFNPETQKESEKLAAELRRAGIRTELYMLDRQIGRQIGYADKKGIPLVALLGADEIAAGVVKFKRLKDGYEVLVERGEVGQEVENLLKFDNSKV